MDIDTQSLIIILGGSLLNGFGGGIVAFVVALRYHRRKDAADKQQETIDAVRNALSATFADVLQREPTNAEVNFYMPRLLDNSLTYGGLENLLHVERQAVQADA